MSDRATAIETWTIAWPAVRDELMRRCPWLQTMPRLLRVMPCSHEYACNIQQTYNERRGVNLPFSPLDWLYLETLAQAGIPQRAVERGIHEMFDRRDRRPFGGGQINSLAYCWQQILREAEMINEASVGSSCPPPRLHAMALLLALPPGCPIFQALQCERQVDDVAEAFQVGIAFTVVPDEYRKHLARERFGVELNFLDPEPSLFVAGSSRLARSSRTGSRQPFLSQEVG